MKKLMGILLATSMVFSLAACGSTADTAASSAAGTTATAEGSSNNQAPDVKVGAIILGDETEGYSAAHINGIKEAAAELGMSDDQIVWKYKIAEGGVTADAAEDLTQDTFLSAFSAIDRCEPQYYKQWLVRVAANKCKDHLKSAWVRKVDAPGDDALPEPRGAPGSDADDPAVNLADRAGAAELEQLVRNLREPYGKIAVMYFLEHKESSEIAKLVGRPPATINSQLWRAKLLLRQQITERRQNE